MEPIKFKYSKPQMLYSLGKFACGAIVGYLIIRSINPNDDWYYILKLVPPVLILLLFIRLLYLSVYFYIPCLRGDIALELDEQRLKYNITGKFLFTKTRGSIYWKELRSLSYDSFRNMDMIRIEMISGDKLVLYIQNVAGDSNLIFAKIKECFQKYG